MCSMVVYYQILHRPLLMFCHAGRVADTSYLSEATFELRPTPEIKLYDGLEHGGGAVLERIGRARADMSNSGNLGVSGGRKD